MSKSFTWFRRVPFMAAALILAVGCAKKQEAEISEESETNAAHFAASADGVRAFKTLTNLGRLAVKPIEEAAKKGQPAPQPNKTLPNGNQMVGMLPGKFKNARVSGLSIPLNGIINPSAKAPSASYVYPNPNGSPYPVTTWILQACAVAYPTDPVAQQECVNNLSTYLGQNGIFIDGTVYGPVYSVFPVSVPGALQGTCLSIYIPPLAVGLACVGNAGTAFGGAWAGCTVFDGCGSGTF